MVNTYLVRALKRVHDQASESLQTEDTPSSEAVADQFNEILEEFQEEYPDYERLQRIEPVQGTRSSMRRLGTVEQAKEDLRQIKLNALKIADLFELDVDDFERVGDRGDLTVINIEQNTEVSQSIEFDNLIERVEGGLISGDEQEELKEIIREYQEELESGDADDSRLRDLVGRAKGMGAGVGQQIAVQLAMMGLQEGYNLLP